MSSRIAALCLCTLSTSCSVNYLYVDADPLAPPESVARVEEGGSANLLRQLSLGECYTDITGVDGHRDADQFVMRPGRHVFALELIAGSRRFLGRIALEVPAGDLLVVARCNDGQFELRLVQLPDGRLLTHQLLRPNNLLGPDNSPSATPIAPDTGGLGTVLGELLGVCATGGANAECVIFAPQCRPETQVNP